MDIVEENARSFSFYKLVHLLEQLTESAPIGGASDPKDERIRLKGTRSVGFPGRDILGMKRTQTINGEVAEVETSFLGLTGSVSPLPTPYTDAVLADESGVLKDFLDLFNHRLLSMTYRAWRASRLGLQLADDREQPLVELALALVGFDPKDTENWGEYPVGWLLRWAGLLAQRPRSAHTLELLLRDSIHPHLVVEQGCQREVRVSEHLLPRLGAPVATLGQHMFIGHTVKDRTGGIRIWIGPATMDEMLAYTPGQSGYQRLQRIVDLVLQDYLDYEIRLVIPREDIYTPRLGGQSGPRLQLTSWVGLPAKAFVYATINGRDGGVTLAQAEDAGYVERFLSKPLEALDG